MTNPILVDMLVRKIKNQEINPKTGEPYTVDDILVQEYKDEVTAMLAQ